MRFNRDEEKKGNIGQSVNSIYSLNSIRILKSQRRFNAISSFSSKYFGWLIALAIVVLGGWFLLPEGYNSLIAIFGPQFGNYLRPTLVMANLMLVNPMNNITMVLIWAGAGFVGGMMAGTKAGGFVVGLITWLSCIGLIVLCVYLLIQGGIALGSFVIPPGASLTDILGIPLVQGMVDQFLPMIAGFGGGGTPDFTALLTPLIIWFFTPLIVVIVAAIIGGTVRKKEAF